MLVRYEDLLKQPEAQIRRVADEFGLHFHAEYAREAVRIYRTGKIGGWEGFFDLRLQRHFDAATQEAAGLVGFR